MSINRSLGAQLLQRPRELFRQKTAHEIAMEMATRAQLLRKLVVEGHLSVPARQALGAVGTREVKDLVKSLLLQDGVFPNHGATNALYEGATLASANSSVQITWQRHYPWDPFQVAERRIETFATLDAAIERFIDSEWRAGINGIRLQ
jgi:hypothetical protein